VIELDVFEHLGTDRNEDFPSLFGCVNVDRGEIEIEGSSKPGGL
jgi:hypothetical protein